VIFAVRIKFVSYIEPTAKLWSELSQIAADEGLQLYDLEKAGQNGLRVFIQQSFVSAPASQEAELKRAAGATSEDCVRLCRRLMRYFAVEGPEFGLSSEPFLEVSSPGLNRALRLEEHFLGAVGETIDLHLVQPEIDATGAKRHHVFGALKKVENGEVEIVNEDGKVLNLPLSNLKKAKVKF